MNGVSHYHDYKKIEMKIESGTKKLRSERSQKDSNLRGDTPMDF